MSSKKDRERAQRRAEAIRQYRTIIRYANAAKKKGLYSLYVTYKEEALKIKIAYNL